jgi:ferritin-like metal-binding protein YciE
MPRAAIAFAFAFEDRVRPPVISDHYQWRPIMTTVDDRLMEWLRDAHAAEEQAEMMLGRMANRLQNYPELKARIQQHVEESKRHAALVRACIERRGGSTSGAKALALGQAMSGMFVDDEVMKGVIASYAFEAMEMASYNILITTARAVRDEQTAGVCEQILRDEQAMALWLEEHFSALTSRYLAREAAPDLVARH